MGVAAIARVVGIDPKTDVEAEMVVPAPVVVDERRGNRRGVAPLQQNANPAPIETVSRTNSIVS